jgi:hypothetical protein
MFAGIILLPLYLQLVEGYSPTAAGLLTLPQVAGTLACPVIAGQVTSRTGRYKILPVTGSVLLLAGMLLLCRLTTATGMAYVESVMFLLGAGGGLYMLTITLFMQNALPQADLGVATSSNTFFRQVGGTAGAAMFLSVSYSAAGSAIRTAYAAARSAGALRAAVRHGPGQAATVRLASSSGSGALNNTSFLQHMNPVLAEPFKQGFTSALTVAFTVAAMVMTTALILALVIRELPLRTTINPAGGPDDRLTESAAAAICDALGRREPGSGRNSPRRRRQCPASPSDPRTTEGESFRARAISFGVRPRSRSSRTRSSVRCQACVPGSRTGRRDAPEPESTAAVESLLATVCIRTMLNVLDHDRMLSLVDAVDDPPLSGEPRAVQPAELTPEGLADTARHIQQRAGDEFHRSGGHVLRQPSAIARLAGRVIPSS